MRQVRERDFFDVAPTERIRSPYVPRKLQAILHRDGHRLIVIVAHRRFGKSYYCSGEIIGHSMNLERENMDLAPPRYAFIAPTIEMATRLGYNPMIRFLGDWPHHATKGKIPRITYPQARDQNVEVEVVFYGAHNIDRTRGGYLDGAVVDEYSEMPGGAWKAAVYPQLADYRGWARIIGTPKGRGPFFKLYKEALSKPHLWGAHYFPASATDILTAEELAFQREELGEEAYLQEYELDWLAAVAGSYYGKFFTQARAEGRLTSVPFNPDHPVTTAWDLGIHDHTVVWFVQRINDQFRFIDHIEETGLPLEKALERVRERTDGLGRPYTYNRHLMPHDLDKRDPWDGRNMFESATQAMRGHGIVEVVTRQSVESGIDACRRILPKCHFDQSKCSDGIDMLSLYRSEYDEKKLTQTKPRKDSASHSADALRTLAVVFEGKGENRKVSEKPKEEEVDWDNPDISVLMEVLGGRSSYLPGSLGRKPWANN